MRFGISRRVVWSLLALLAVAAAGAAIWFRAYLGPPAGVLGQWSGAVASLPSDAGLFANANGVDVAITRIGQGGSLIGTVTIGEASSPLSGRILGHHISLVADFSPASVGAPRPRFSAEGAVDGDTIETRTTLVAGAGDATNVLIDGPVALLRGGKPRSPSPRSSPIAASQAAVPAMSLDNSLPVTADDAEAVAALVRQYYSLWDSQRLTDAYGLLSARYRAANPYSVWEKTHEGVVHIAVTATTTSNPAVVAVAVWSTDKSGSGTVDSEYHGSWVAIREADGLKLDRVALNRTK